MSPPLQGRRSRNKTSKCLQPCSEQSVLRECRFGVLESHCPPSSPPCYRRNMGVSTRIETRASKIWASEDRNMAVRHAHGYPEHPCNDTSVRINMGSDSLLCSSIHSGICGAMNQPKQCHLWRCHAYTLHQSMSQVHVYSTPLRFVSRLLFRNLAWRVA